MADTDPSRTSVPGGARPIRRVIVVGAGTMGHGIAHAAALAGCDVRLVDASIEIATRGRDRILANLQEGITRGKLTETQRDDTIARVHPAAILEDAASDADLVIEAIPEQLKLKQDLFRRLDGIVAEDSILATNTSSLSITEIQRATRHPRRVIGLHFFNPVHIMKLVEVVRGEDSDEDYVDAGVRFARGLGKEPILVNDAPGFASSRLGVALGLEAMRMLEEGVASAADIDRAMELGYRHPMGPLRLTDLVGLDVRLSIARYLHEKLGAAHFEPPAILERLVSEGKLGKKSGHGFYEWTTENAS